MAIIREAYRSSHTITDHTPKRFDVIVIGGGPACLAAGFHLARGGLRFIILDAQDRISVFWRTRWDSL